MDYLSSGEVLTITDINTFVITIFDQTQMSSGFPCVLSIMAFKNKSCIEPKGRNETFLMERIKCDFFSSISWIPQVPTSICAYCRYPQMCCCIAIYS